MATISISRTGNLVKEKAKRTSLVKRYLAYVAEQEGYGIYWYLLSIMIFPCVIMIPSIFVLGLLTESYVWFMSLSVLLFYANVMAHVGETKSTFYVPLFHLTTLFMIAVPLITYFIK